MSRGCLGKLIAPIPEVLASSGGRDRLTLRDDYRHSAEDLMDEDEDEVAPPVPRPNQQIVNGA